MGARELQASREKGKHGEDTYLRLLAPQHIIAHSFREHRRLDGMRQDVSRPAFLHNDRLFALETIYGKVQMGYDPGRGEPFLLANIKTSIHDYAPSSYQREYSETDRYSQMKGSSQDIAFTSRRYANSIVHLYKRENEPWSYAAVAPYLGRVNMEALSKVMPFLDSREEVSSLAESRREKRGLEDRLRELTASGSFGEMAVIRRREHELLLTQDFYGMLIRRKKSMMIQFFRRLNGAYDWQKQDIFAYYRERNRSAVRALREAEISPSHEEDEDE